MSPTVSVLERIDTIKAPLTAADLWSRHAYAESRRELVRELIALKRARRVRIGEHCSMVFETRASVWFQIQEELHLHAGDWHARADNLVHEYEQLVPTQHELRASLFLECCDVDLASALSVYLARHIDALALHLPCGRFVAKALESLTDGIRGVAFLRFVRDPSGLATLTPWLRWAAPEYPVNTMLPTDVARTLANQLAHSAWPSQ